MRIAEIRRLLLLMSLAAAGCGIDIGPYEDEQPSAPCGAASCAPAPPPESVCRAYLTAERAEDGCGVFVDVFVGDDENPGTQDKPVESLSRGIALARTGRGRVFLCGNYSGATELPSGVDIVGSFDCMNDWTRINPNGGPLIYTFPSRVALTIEPASPGDTGAADGVSTLVDLRIQGGYDVGLFVRSGSAVEIVRSEIFGSYLFGTEQGQDATTLPEPPEGAPGNGGVQGCSVAPAAGGVPAMTSCDDGAVTIGGKGGDGGATASGDGGDGGDGVPAPGAPGQGGGGGGGLRGSAALCGVASRSGPSGGSGGGGGCGGKGGKGGANGIPSIAILALHAKVTVRDSLIKTRQGVPGTDGGEPQDGSRGGRGGAGAYSPDEIARACDGGDGGIGGRGGYGGGGRGGDSSGSLRPEDVVDPAVERRDLRACLDARALVVGEHEPCTRKQPQQRVPLTLELVAVRHRREDGELGLLLRLGRVDDLGHDGRTEHQRLDVAEAQAEVDVLRRPGSHAGVRCDNEDDRAAALLGAHDRGPEEGEPLRARAGRARRDHRDARVAV
ncbi:hypothetical protein ACMHYB_50005 [Sorangium sp. So ce1128]